MLAFDEAIFYPVYASWKKVGCCNAYVDHINAFTIRIRYDKLWSRQSVYMSQTDFRRKFSIIMDN